MAEKDGKKKTKPNKKFKKNNQRFRLCLYVTGTTPRSIQAISNIKKFCEDYLDNYELEVIDIYQQPELARKEQIIAVPMLVKKLPQPLQKFIGDLSNTERILVGLNVKSKDGRQK